MGKRKKGRPLVLDHYQPHIPLNQNYYDLRDSETRIKQAEMAKSAGIFGFCYYHYWFNGKRLLNLPIDQVLKTNKPDFPFCLAWANEDWTRSWDGESGNILIKQHYSHEDDINHIHFLKSIFNDKRYIRVDGKPLFIIYSPERFPNIQKTLQTWRNEAVKIGINDLYICYFENRLQNIDPKNLGFDAAIEFQPNWRNLTPPINRNNFGIFLKKIGINLNVYYANNFYDYLEYIKKIIKISKKYSYKRYRCVMPAWDNSARRRNGNATIFLNSNPKYYEFWIKSVLRDFKPFSCEENLIFINAWNEWGEGNHLEPCQKWQYQYLKKQKNVFPINNLEFSKF